MTAVIKTITLADQQAAWLRSQVENGRYLDDSEAIRDLIRREQGRAAELQAIRDALIEGEQSGEPQPFDLNAFFQDKAAVHG
jgi:antitoxin ParD1/3/4